MDLKKGLSLQIKQGLRKLLGHRFYEHIQHRSQHEFQIARYLKQLMLSLEMFQL
jgi:hypothetical protein